jgi:hypothetical protein
MPTANASARRSWTWRSPTACDGPWIPGQRSRATPLPARGRSALAPGRSRGQDATARPTGPEDNAQGSRAPRDDEPAAMHQVTRDIQNSGCTSCTVRRTRYHRGDEASLVKGEARGREGPLVRGYAPGGLLCLARLSSGPARTGQGGPGVREQSRMPGFFFTARPYKPIPVGWVQPTDLLKTQGLGGLHPPYDDPDWDRLSTNIRAPRGKVARGWGTSAVSHE